MLAHACLIVEDALGEQAYLVGSATESRDYRDVDIRMIFDDDKYETLFGEAYSETSPFWSLLCASISEYLQNRTGLPVDFQIQKRSRVSEADWPKERIPVSVYPGNVRPAWASL